ncbi:hypothetical protein [Acetobacter okinawensis]|uniref:hypothetical protein n=1 Tax=Acetobacter okinawensis TaxID=1076594 RepID=UPI000A823E81|nr:hypothetical protein [Acetobacter okinawensis]
MPDGVWGHDWPDLSLVHAPDRLLLLSGDAAIGGRDFLWAAHQLAALLPDAPVVPVCSCVGHFTLLFAATLLRGQHVLLCSERTPARLTPDASRMTRLPVPGSASLRMPTAAAGLALLQQIASAQTGEVHLASQPGSLRVMVQPC